MLGGIVEIVDDDRRLSLYRGFIVISDKGGELGRLPLADVTAIIVSAHNAGISKNILVALAEQNTAVIFCNKSYLPTSIALPYTGNYEAASRMRAQIAASRPLCKQIWKRLVQEKIRNQAAVLSWRGATKAGRKLAAVVRRVRSGDQGNLEAQAARWYWPVVLRHGFARDRFAADENILFNYCYTVLRSAVARSVVGAGLLPALGVHHRGRLNPFSLVDDLMEPYRPLADSLVIEALEGMRPFSDSGEVRLTPEVKRFLAGLLRLDLATSKGVSPLCEALHAAAYSLVQSYEDKKERLELGELLLPRKNLEETQCVLPAAGTESCG